MLPRRSQGHAALHNETGSTFDQITFHTFMLAVTVTTAVVLSYGPVAAMHHLVEVLSNLPNPPLSDEPLWLS